MSQKKKRPKVKSGIKIVIHGVKKKRETIVKDTVGVIEVGTIELYGFKHKSESKFRADSDYFWAHGKKFKDKSLENGLSFDSYKLLTLGKFTIKRNIDFLKKLVSKHLKIGKINLTKPMYEILKMGEQDALVAKLIAKTYMLINLEDIVIDIPHNFSEYLVFFKKIQKSITEGIKINKLKNEEIGGIIKEDKDFGKDKEQTEFLNPADIVKHFKSKLFITLQNFNVLLQSCPGDLQMLRFRKFVKSYLNKTVEYDH